MMRYAWLTVLLPVLLAGCVTRRYTIESDPPGAMVYRNGEQIGLTPVTDYFVYYGTYEFTLVREGYETLTVEQCIDTPWYQYPGIDFLAENLNPWRVTDDRTFRYQLQPLRAVRHDEVLGRAGELRQRGQTIRSHVQSNAPPPDPAPPEASGGEVLPAPTSLPASPAFSPADPGGGFGGTLWSPPDQCSDPARTRCTNGRPRDLEWSKEGALRPPLALEDLCPCRAPGICRNGK